MKILYLVRQDPEPSMKEIQEIHAKSHEVTVVDVRQEKDYDKIVSLIESNDKIISV